MCKYLYIVVVRSALVKHATQRSQTNILVLKRILLIRFLSKSKGLMFNVNPCQSDMGYWNISIFLMLGRIILNELSHNWKDGPD